MAIYQCLFFKNGTVAYWENIEAGTSSQIQVLLADEVLAEGWHEAEAWLDDALICRVGSR